MRRSVLFVYTLWALGSAVIDAEDFLFATKEGVTLYHSGVQAGFTDLSTSGRVYYLDYHFSKNLLFVQRENKLFKQTLDPNRTSEVDVVDAQLVKELSKCAGFAVDWLHDRIYAVNCGSTTADILAFGLNGEDQRTVVSWERPRWAFDMIRTEIDPYKGKLFWTDFERIQSVGTSGEGFLPNMTKAETAVRALALDVRMRRVYYVGKMGGIASLYSMNYTGGEEMEHGSASYVFINTYELGILGDKLFWANYTDRKDVVYEAPLALTENVDMKTLTFINEYVYDMKILHPALQECPPGQTLHPNSVSCLVIEEDGRFGVIVLNVVLVLGVVLVAVILVKVADKYWHRLGGETLRVPYSRNRGREGDGELTAGATEYYKGEDRVNLA